MVKMKVETRLDVKKIMRKAERGNIDSLYKAAGYVRKTARSMIKRRGKGKKTQHSAPGKPPRTKNGRLKRSMRFAVEAKKQRAIIGPTYEGMGGSAAAHEFGGTHKGDRFPARPFMGPTNQITADKLPEKWRGSIK